MSPARAVAVLMLCLSAQRLYRGDSSFALHHADHRLSGVEHQYSYCIRLLYTVVFDTVYILL